MPTYEYECLRCGHHFERFQSMKAEPLKRCPKCRCKVRRLLGAGAGILFKGSGFYETDYKRTGRAEGAAAEKKATSESKGDDGKAKKKDSSSTSPKEGGGGESDKSK